MAIEPTISIGAMRSAAALDPRLAAPAQKRGSAPSPVPVATPAGVLDAGAPPLDAARVTQIRKAIEQGTYPLVPARIADAMIAAGMLWRSPE